MNKLFKNTLSAITGLIMAANLAVVPVLADGEEVTSTSTITVYENYNHRANRDDAAVNLDYTEWLTETSKLNYTYVNFSVPQMDTSKLIKAELKATLKKCENIKTLTFYAKHIPYSTWRTLLTAHMQKDKVFVDANTNPGVATTVTRAAYTGYEAAMSALPAEIELGSESVDPTSTPAGTTLTMDITDYIKSQITAGIDDIDIFATGGNSATTLYSGKTSGVTAEQKPQIVYTIDTSSLESLNTENSTKAIDSVTVRVNEQQEDYEPQVITAIYNSGTGVLESVKITENEELKNTATGQSVKVNIEGCSKEYIKSADEYYSKVFIMDLNNGLMPLSQYTYAD